MDRAQELRELAAWYRDFAERAGSPWIWEARLRRARELERGADELASKVKTSSSRSSVRSACDAG
jgi:hypothetical protein